MQGPFCTVLTFMVQFTHTCKVNVGEVTVCEWVEKIEQNSLDIYVYTMKRCNANVSTWSWACESVKIEQSSSDIYVYNEIL